MPNDGPQELTSDQWTMLAGWVRRVGVLTGRALPYNCAGLADAFQFPRISDNVVVRWQAKPESMAEVLRLTGMKQGAMSRPRAEEHRARIERDWP